MNLHDINSHTPEHAIAFARRWFAQHNGSARRLRYHTNTDHFDYWQYTGWHPLGAEVVHHWRNEALGGPLHADFLEVVP